MKMIRSRIIRNSALLCIGLMSLPVSASASSAIIANEEPDMEKITRARRIIAGLQHDLEKFTEKGSGPFVAAVYDGDGKLVAKMPNTVVLDKCSHNHAEMNAIRAAEEKLGTHDLTPFNMKLYVTAEPCAMCLGGITVYGNIERELGEQALRKSGTPDSVDIPAPPKKTTFLLSLRICDNCSMLFMITSLHRCGL